jgi:gliding motility-associated-like protein
MPFRIRHIVLNLLFFIFPAIAGQEAVTDSVNTGVTRSYFVDLVPGSTYTWWIDGTVQDENVTNEMIRTWMEAGSHLIEVMESSAVGCSGPVRSLQVLVIDNVNPVALCKNITVPLDLNTGTVTINVRDIDARSYDNVGIRSMSLSKTDFNCTDLGENSVTLTVADGSGNIGTCTAIVTVRYSVDPAPVVIPAADVICSDETINLALTNNIPGTSWTWTASPEAGISGAAGDNSGNLSVINQILVNRDINAHNVTYTITPHAYGVCDLGQISSEIRVNPRLDFTREISDFNGYNVSCFGSTNGFIRLHPSDYLNPLSFSWTGPGGFKSSARDLVDIAAGKYIIVITDKNNCQTIDSINMIESGKLSMLINPSISFDGAYNINCAGEKSVSIAVSQVNGVGHVQYLWSDGSTGNVRNNLPAGTQRIIVTDANNCQADTSVTLTEPDPIRISFDVLMPYCPDKPDGQITASASGGVPGSGYIYLWSDNKFTGGTLADIPAGTYYLTVTDVNRCNLTESVHLKTQHDMCLWNIGNTDLYPDMEVTIYNRWGQSVWKSDKGYHHPWDGKRNGRPLPVDSYHYAIDLHNGSRIYMGTVTIVK